MNKFRPHGIPKSYLIKQLMRFGRRENYNWQTRVKWYPAGWGFNKKVIGDQHSRLHYLARHAPDPIKKRWAKAYDNFQAKHFGTRGNASMRYLNKWSCYSWM